MRLDISKWLRLDPSFPLDPVRVNAGSPLPVVILGVPAYRGPDQVVGVHVAVTNADGVTVEIPLGMFGDCTWRGTFAASNFTNYGTVDNGFAVILVMVDGSLERVASGIFEVLATSPSTQPGDPGNYYQRKGDDEYHRSEVVEGVQHYKKVEIAYDADMGAWGFDLTGDYILNNSGEFVPADETEGE